MITLDDFEGITYILLRPIDQNVPYKFKIKTCSSESANDQFLPYNLTIQSVEVTARKDTTSGFVDASAEMISSYSLAADIITILLNYPGEELGVGTYQLLLDLTLSNGTTIKQALFPRIIARNNM